MRCWTLALLLLSAAAAEAQPVTLRSPGGRIAVEVATDTGGTPTYTVRFRDRVLIVPSSLGLAFERYQTIASGMTMQAGTPRSGEDRYRLDRMLTQLLRAGWLDGVAGIALGSWFECEDGVRALMLDRLGGLGVPVVWELGFGHGPSSLTVPLGVPATLDADTATLTLGVPALE